MEASLSAACDPNDLRSINEVMYATALIPGGESTVLLLNVDWLIVAVDQLFTLVILDPNLTTFLDPSQELRSVTLVMMFWKRSADEIPFGSEMPSIRVI